jgi:hypothetical protein
MGVGWPVIAALCVAVGVLLLVVERGRRRAPPPGARVPEPSSPDGGLGTRDALRGRSANGW